MSTTSGGGTSDTRPPVSPSGMSLPPVKASVESSVGVVVEAHRACELKWISVMFTMPPSQAWKGKKIANCFRRECPGKCCRGALPAGWLSEAGIATSEFKQLLRVAGLCVVVCLAVLVMPLEVAEVGE